MSTIARIAAFFMLFVMCARVSTTGSETTKRRAVRWNPPPLVEAKHYRGGPSRTGVYDTAGPQLLHGQAWRIQAAASSYSAPVYAAGSLYLTDGTGREVALEALTGAVRWRTPFLSSILSAATVTVDAVYIGSDARAVIALSVTDGHEITRFDVDGEVFASPLIDGDTLYVATESGALYAFDIPSRQQKWKFAGAGPAHGHPAASNGSVYYGSGGALVAVDRAGQERWRVSGTSPFFSPSLAVNNGTVFGSSSDTVYAIDATNGQTRWTFSGATHDTGFSAPVVWNGLLIFGTVAPYALVALNVDTGTLAWQTPLSAFIEPILAGGILYGGSGELGQSANPTAPQKVYAFDPLNGRQLWSADVTGQVITGAAVGDGKVFVYTQARNVYAFD